MIFTKVHFGMIQFSNKHTEIFGTFIEIIKKYNWRLTIYYNLDNDEYTFLKYYEKIFGKLDICPINQINYELYIFIITINVPKLSVCLFENCIIPKCTFVKII